MAAQATVCELLYDHEYFAPDIHLPKMTQSKPVYGDEFYDWTLLHAKEMQIRRESNLVSPNQLRVPAPSLCNNSARSDTRNNFSGGSGKPRAHTAGVMNNSSNSMRHRYRVIGSAKDRRCSQYKHSLVWMDSLNGWIPENRAFRNTTLSEPMKINRIDSVYNKVDECNSETTKNVRRNFSGFDDIRNMFASPRRQKSAPYRSKPSRSCMEFSILGMSLSVPPPRQPSSSLSHSESPKYMNFIERPSINLKSVSITEVRESQGAHRHTCSKDHRRLVPQQYTSSAPCEACREEKNEDGLHPVSLPPPTPPHDSDNSNTPAPPVRNLRFKTKYNMISKDPQGDKTSEASLQNVAEPLVVVDSSEASKKSNKKTTLESQKSNKNNSVESTSTLTPFTSEPNVVDKGVFVEGQVERVTSPDLKDDNQQCYGQGDATKNHARLPEVLPQRNRQPINRQPISRQPRGKNKRNSKVKLRDKPDISNGKGKLETSYSAIKDPRGILGGDNVLNTPAEEDGPSNSTVCLDAAPLTPVPTVDDDSTASPCLKSGKSRRPLKVRIARDVKRKEPEKVYVAAEEVQVATPSPPPSLAELTEDKLVTLETQYLELPDLPSLAEKKGVTSVTQKVRSQISVSSLSPDKITCDVSESDGVDEARLRELAELRRRKLMNKITVKAAREKRIMGDDKEKMTRFEDCDFLSKYCIFQSDSLDMYRQCFESIDEEGGGYITNDEALLGLRVMNTKLSTQDFTYMDRILELVGYNTRTGADVKLFSVMAALSTKISSLDAWMKSLVDQMDMSSLEYRMFMCKTLWECNVDSATNQIPMHQLSLDLRAGGVSAEHEIDVFKKLSHLVYLDLLDFLTYIPLFLLIHSSVVINPLDDSRDK